MPKKLEQKLKREAAAKKGWSEARRNAYVYSVLRDVGKKTSRERKKS